MTNLGDVTTEMGLNINVKVTLGFTKDFNQINAFTSLTLRYDSSLKLLMFKRVVYLYYYNITLFLLYEDPLGLETVR